MEEVEQKTFKYLTIPKRMLYYWRKRDSMMYGYIYTRGGIFEELIV